MAYSELEPFGSRHRDQHFGILGATMANCHRGKDSRPFEPDQFRMRTVLDRPRRQGKKSILDLFKGLKKKNGD